MPLFLLLSSTLVIASYPTTSSGILDVHWSINWPLSSKPTQHNPSGNKTIELSLLSSSGPI
uniref:Secreted protein n=1 Tax=Phakopsora pachyrhizi TaxID=170000 RepID=A0A0S1MK52_PHAPC